MNSKVQAFFLRHNFPLHTDVSSVCNAILLDMNRGLRKEKSDQDMIRTFSLPPKNPASNKSVIVIDAGGTNFRSCLVTFNDKGEPVISEMEKTVMPGVKKELSKKEFFDEFASNLEHLKDKSTKIGFCFSYPMTITEDGDGVLINFSKEVKAPEVEGQPIGKCLKEALLAHGWKNIERITMLNDTVAALLAGKACAKDYPYSSYIGFILGTGMNAAYIQPEIAEAGVKKQIIVCESGKTCSVIMSDFDKNYDAISQKPGTAFIEKQCAGGYLGPVAFQMLKLALSDGLFSDAFAKKLAGLKELSLIEFDAFLHDPYNRENLLASLACGSASEEDYTILYELLDALLERSAHAAAAILSAAVIQSGEGKNPCKPVLILADGSTFWKSSRIYERVSACLEEELTVKAGLYWKIISCDNDITIGTAIAGLIE